MGGLSVATWCAGAYAVLLAVRALCAWRELRRQQAAPVDHDAVRMRDVAVLQPILGGDPRLPDVLGATLAALPQAQFHWLVDTDDAAGRWAVARLRAAHPQVAIRVHENPPAPDGTNPKTFKLDRALPQVDAPVCLVLDDDATLSADALARLVSALDRADIATALPGYVAAGERLPGRLLAQFVNDNAALTYLAPLALAPPVSINGMCYALRTGRLRALGGFAPLLHALADDLAMADHVRAHGGRIAQTIAPVRVRTSVDDAAHYVRQMHRWMLFATLLLRRQPVSMRLTIGVLHGLPPLLLWAMGVGLVLQPDWGGLTSVAGVLMLRAGVPWMLQDALGAPAPQRPVLSVWSELLQPLHLLHACYVRTIRWRSRRYRVRADGGFRAV
ncbi:glycosyltransferase family 2 protein [Luteimonas terrae]|uniref:glycosyltransferase family 2 protein n=1 Tax=Luteimonas terrae TaxID=1530191 RepID=UPI001FB76E44|nr:glycosyltransferase [Luteimonas terrae]